MLRTLPMRLAAGAVLALGPAAAADAAPLPDPIRAMLANALKSQDPAVLAAVAAVARQTAPDAEVEIDAIVQGDVPADPAPQPPPILTIAAPVAKPKAPEWRGSLELGGSHTGGTTTSVGAYGAVDVSKTAEDWTHRLTARAEYRETEGVRTAARAAMAYQPQINLRPSLYAYGLGQFEHDRFLGYRSRFGMGLGVGLRLADRPNFQAAVDLGPALRRTDYYRAEREDTVAGRAGANLKWLPTERITLAQETAVYREGRQTSVKSQTSLETLLIGPLKGKLSYNLNREDDPRVDRTYLDTTTRASLLYSF